MGLWLCRAKQQQVAAEQDAILGWTGSAVSLKDAELHS